MVPETQCAWTKIHGITSQISLWTGLIILELPGSFDSKRHMVAITNLLSFPCRHFEPVSFLLVVLLGSWLPFSCGATKVFSFLTWYTWLRFHWKKHNGPPRRKWNIPIHKDYMGWNSVNNLFIGLTFVK